MSVSVSLPVSLSVSVPVVSVPVVAVPLLSVAPSVSLPLLSVPLPSVPGPAVVVPAEVTDAIRPGVVSLPHGWGHGRPGTRMAVAAEHMFTYQRSTAEHTAALAERIYDAVLDVLPSAERLGHPERRLPHILSLRLPEIVGQTLLERCDAQGLAFSTGSACHAGGDAERKPKKPRKDDGKPDNHVLAAIGFDRRAAREVVRLSFSGETTVEDADDAADILCAELERLLAAAPRRTTGGAPTR